MPRGIALPLLLVHELRDRPPLRWIPTGVVYLEELIRDEVDDGSDDARYVPHSLLFAD